MPRKTSVVNVKKKFLQENGYQDFEDWISYQDHVYIGRNMNFYVPGTKQSKWCNPYSVKKYGRKNALRLYQKYITESDLYHQLEELEGKVLGCWCHPEKCHGDILIKLLREKNKLDH